MTEASTRRPKRLRLGSLARVLLPSVVTLILIVMLVVTMFFTEFDWQWVTFLTGILFASVLSLVSASWKSGFRMARRTAEAVHFRQRLSAEIQQHKSTREQLERELALHQHDRVRLARQVEALQSASHLQLAAESLLAMLELHLHEIAFYLDRQQRFRFHTRKFSEWASVAHERIDGSVFGEILLQRNLEALRPLLLNAMDGRAVRAELLLARADGSGHKVTVDCVPHQAAEKEVLGTLVLIREAQASGASAPLESESPPVEEIRPGATKLLIADETGNTIALNSLTEELNGWSNPRERIQHAIQSDGFDLHAQDIISLHAEAPLKTMRELLIRMRDEEQNMVPPGTFLPIAERLNLMPAIDRFVVNKAIAACAAADPAQAPVLCINLARASLIERAFPKFVALALEQSGVAGAMLCFEIADADAIACLAETTRFARELKPLGCRFSLDGFGRAGVGFEHVKALPLDFIKIDGSIILQILRAPDALAKVRAIQRVSQVIGILTIAEMVESNQTLERLRTIGVDYAQGFGVATPQLFSQGTG